MALCVVYALEQWYAKRCGLARSCLCEGYDVVAVSQQIGYYLFLYWHGVFKSQLFDGAANLFADAQFFKCLQCVLMFLLVRSVPL